MCVKMKNNYHPTKENH